MKIVTTNPITPLSQVSDNGTVVSQEIVPHLEVTSPITQGDNGQNNIGAREINLSAIGVAIISQITPFAYSTDEEIAVIVKDSMIKRACKVAQDLGIDPNKLIPLLPSIISTAELVKAQAQQVSVLLEQLPPDYCKELIKKIPTALLQELPESLLNKLFTPEELEAIKETKNTGTSDVAGGGFTPDYKVSVNNQLIRSGKYSPYRIGAHEGNHAIWALLRTLLTKEQIDVAVISQLKDEIINGSLRVLTGGGMRPLLYIPSSQMRSEIAEFVNDAINNLDKEDDKFKKETFREGQISLEMVRTSELGKNALFEIANKHKDFMNLCNNDEACAKLLLADLVDTQIFRFNLAIGAIPLLESTRLTLKDEVFNQLPQDKVQELRDAIQNSPKALNEIKDYAKNHLLCIEGNAKLQLKLSHGLTPSMDDVMDYEFCKEELECDLRAAELELSIPNLDIKTEDKLKSEIIYHEVGGKLIEYMKRVSIAEQDPQMVKMANEFNFIRLSHGELELDIKNIFKDFIEPIANEIPDLNNLIATETALRAQLSQIYIMQDSWFLKGKTQENIQTRLEIILNVRKTIVDLISKSDLVPLDKVKKLNESLKNQETLLAKMKTLREAFPEGILNPLHRVKDPTLLASIEDTKDQIADLAQKVSS